MRNGIKSKNIIFQMDVEGEVRILQYYQNLNYVSSER